MSDAIRTSPVTDPETQASSQADRVVGYMAQVTNDDLVALGQLLASEEVTSVIDRTFPLELAAQAMAVQGSKRIRGKVVLVVKTATSEG